MFKRTPSEPTGIDLAIDHVLSEMAGPSTDSEEYAQMVDQLVKLHELKTTEGRPRISPDTLATISANLLGILMIVGYERVHVMTSKALGFVKS